MPETPTGPKGAAELTTVANQAAATSVTFDDEADFQRAQQGLIATLPEGRVLVDDQVVWDCAHYDLSLIHI